MLADFCVIGAGVVGRYIVRRLYDAGLRVEWISAPHENYLSKNTNYQISDHIGNINTWREKATGLISYPGNRDLSTLPLSPAEYEEHKRLLKNELGILSSSKVIADASEYNRALCEYLALHCSQEFDLTYPPNIFPPSIYDRDEYDSYWMNLKKPWNFVSDDQGPLYGRALSFVKRGFGDWSLLFSDKSSTVQELKAKNYIVCCHTPGTLSLLARTCQSVGSTSSFQLRYSLGRGVFDHPQLSFGILLRDRKLRRDLPPAMVFGDSDENKAIPYRIEVHNAPPRRKAMRRSLEQFPYLREQDYLDHFLRLTMVMRLPEESDARLEFLSNEGSINTEYQIKPDFELLIRGIVADAVRRMKAVHIDKNDIILLNHHHPYYFGAHLGGGTLWENCTTNGFTLRDMSNVHVASLSLLPSLGLYNPTFTLLVMCRHLLQKLLH